MLVGLPWNPKEHEVRIRGIAAAVLIAAVAACSDDQPTSPAVPLDVQASKAANGEQVVSISPAVDTVQVGKTIKLVGELPGPNVTGADSSAADSNSAGRSKGRPSLSWSVDDTTIAKVSHGRVTGRKPGTVTVTARSRNRYGVATVVVRGASDSSSSADSSAGGTSADSSTINPSGEEVGSLFSDYNATTPHWSHIRTLATDFYYKWTPTERSWAGEHFDAALSGSGDAWRAVNPGVTHLPYTLFWTLLKPSSTTTTYLSSSYYDDMKAWYASHPEYKLEDAFLHSSTIKSSSTRLTAHIWDSDRWMINPADPGARAYTVDRYKRLVAGEEGVFIDELTSSDVMSRVDGAADLSNKEYETAFTSLLAEIKKAYGSKMIMLNIAEYTKDFDLANAQAAGAVHLEMFNNPLLTQMHLRWDWVEKLRSLGVSVDMVSPYPAEWGDEHSSQYPKGNYATSSQRMQMWELASYYMVVGQSPEGLYFHMKAPDWDTPFEDYWFRAIEANIGHPTGPRRVEQEGTDPVGQAYTIYARDFDRALVLIRPQRGWGTQSYLDATAVEMTLPSGESWLPLHADGTLGAPVTKVKLRNSESLILVRKSRT